VHHHNLQQGTLEVRPRGVINRYSRVAGGRGGEGRGGWVDSAQPATRGESRARKQVAVNVNV